MTLTKRGKFADLDELWRSFNNFNRSCTRLFGPKWQYVAVPELHGDGETWHMHLAIRGFLAVTLLRRLWGRSLGGTGREVGSGTLGNIDVSYSRASGGSVRGIYRYLAKYLAKAARIVPGGKRVVNSSRGIGEGVVSRWLEPVSLGLSAPYGIVRRRVSNRRGIVSSVAWWDYGGSHGFTINVFADSRARNGKFVSDFDQGPGCAGTAPG